MKHDYEAALNELQDTTFLDAATVNAAIHALKLADKVTQEPSEGMIEAAIDSYNHHGVFALVTHHKAMVAQAIKEVEG